MNQAYAGAGISWVLAAPTTRTVNSDWFNHSAPGTSQQDAMKSSLRVGGPETLNVYTVGYAICSCHAGRCFSYVIQLHLWFWCWPPRLRYFPLGLREQPYG